MRRERYRRAAMIMLVMILVCLLFLAAGCGKEDDSDGGDGEQEVVTEETRETFDVETGQYFDFSLESNPTTGYSWQAAQSPDESIVSIVSSGFVAPGGDLVGAPGEEVWQFRAVGAGTTTMVLEYARPWETDVPPVKRYTLTFNVAQADNEVSQSFRIVAGQTFDLILDTEPSAGYAWSMTQQPDAGILRLVSSEVTGGGAPGAPQQQIWKFEGVSAGNTSFVLEYRGPGGNAPVERKNSVKVTVTAAPVPPPTPPVTYSDPSVPINARRGEVFILQVKAAGGTGYQWRLVEDVDAKVLRFMGYTTTAAQEIGGEVTTEFSFEALGTGRQAIKLGLYAPGGDDPTQAVEFDVTVE